MSLAATYDSTTMLVDLKREGANLETDEGLEAAVLISIFTHRRSPEDLLPAHMTDRKGWWGNSVARVRGDEVGSLLWVLSTRALTDELAAEAKAWLESCLSWMVADGVTDSVSVETSRSGDIFRFRVTIARPSDPYSKWQRTWEVRFNAV